MRGADLRRTLVKDAPVYILMALYIATMSVLFASKGLPLFMPVSLLANVVLLLAGCLVILATCSLFVLVRERPGRPLRFLAGLAARWQLRARLWALFPFLLALSAFSVSFSMSKSAIHLFNPYSHDALFIRMDAAVHGQQAWQLIQPLTGYPLVSFLLDITYRLWFLLLFVGVPLVCQWIERPALRLQFLITYVLGWAVIGTGLAIAFSSVGPCFVDEFFGDQRFNPLMDYLARADARYPIWALDVQKKLIDWQMQHSHELGRGISAMPSMHVSVACLFAIIAWRFSRPAGIAATLFLVLILIGSVHLGYHYAVDGYASILLTLVLWRVAGRLVRMSAALTPDAS